MFDVRGKYNIARVFTDMVDNPTISQIQTLCNMRVYQDSNIRIMPDCHAGAGCVVGTTMSLVDAVTPNLVGVDIGCGILAVKLKEKRINLPEFDSVIRKYIPSGAGVHDTVKCMKSNFENMRCIKNGANIQVGLAYLSQGTLGGGNHFIELDRDSNDDIWLVIHSGSRHLGIEVCDWYQKQAFDRLKFIANNGNYETKRNALIEKMHREGRNKEISKALVKFKREYTEVNPSIPYELAYCTDDMLESYLYDMKLTQEHARLNRETMAKIILSHSGLHIDDYFDTIHNYIDTDLRILRKGSVSAQYGERLIIPMNMRDGSLICVGKGNPEWNYSAPHGAGRLYSRSVSKEMFSLSEYKKTMKEAGIYTTSVCQGTLDECPMVYKPIEMIMDNIQDTVEIIDVIKPIYNFKASNVE